MVWKTDLYVLEMAGTFEVGIVYSKYPVLLSVSGHLVAVTIMINCPCGAAVMVVCRAKENYEKIFPFV